MSFEHALLEFAQRLNNDILNAEDEVYHFRSQIFTRKYCELLEEGGVFEQGHICFYERADRRGSVAAVDGYSLNENNDTLCLLRNVFLERDSFRDLPLVHKKTLEARAGEVRRFLKQVVEKKIHEEMEKALPTYDMASLIHSAFANHAIGRVKVLIVTNGNTEYKELSSFAISGVEADVEIWDIERLYRVSSDRATRHDIEIDFLELYEAPLPCLPAPQVSDEYEAFLAVFPGNYLFDFYEKFGDQLLELNVRSFLQARGKVNRGIRDTIRNDPGSFLAFNNGVYMTVDELELDTLDDGSPGIACMRGLQIVNGAQTTASIHRAKSKDGADLSDVHVAAKIVLVPGEEDQQRHGKLEELARHISLFANTQNVVKMADFSSNHPYHVAIEQLSKSIWCPGETERWFYERARGQYDEVRARTAKTKAQKKKFDQQHPKNKKFTKTDIARFIQSWDQLPHLVSKGAQKNFVLFMDQLDVEMRAHREEHGQEWSPEEEDYKELIAKAILFKTTQKIVRQEKFPAYRTNIVTYLISYLSYIAENYYTFDFNYVWENQELTEELVALLRRWSRSINESIRTSAGDRNVTEWCKKEECWAAIQKLDLELPDDEEFPNELIED